MVNRAVPPVRRYSQCNRHSNVSISTYSGRGKAVVLSFQRSEVYLGVQQSKVPRESLFEGGLEFQAALDIVPIK